MKKILLITLIAVLPVFAFGATATATVGGTLKVYQIISLAQMYDMIFPAQFAGVIATNLINVEGQAPATGIPMIVGETIGRAGKIGVTGTGGTYFTPSIASPMTLINGASTLLPVLTLHNDAAFTAAPPTVIPGTGYSQIANIYIKGNIPLASTLLPGTYTGSATFTATYN